LVVGKSAARALDATPAINMLNKILRMGNSGYGPNSGKEALAPLTSLAYRKESPESLLPVDHKHAVQCGENRTTMGK